MGDTYIIYSLQYQSKKLLISYISCCEHSFSIVVVDGDALSYLTIEFTLEDLIQIKRGISITSLNRDRLHATLAFSNRQAEIMLITLVALA